MRSLALLIALAGVSAPAPSSIRYDQTQTGDMNIHLDLKNVEVLALLDEAILGSAQYDDYDYDDLTLKPPPAPAQWNSSHAEGAPSLNGTGSGVSGGEGGGGEDGNSPKPTSSFNGTSGVTPTDNGYQQPPTRFQVNKPGRPSRRCGAGFYRDAFGKCRRLKRPTPQATLQSLAKSAQTKGSPRPGEVVVVSDTRPLTIVSKDELNQKSPLHPGVRVTPPEEFEGPPRPGETPSAALLQALAASKVDALEGSPPVKEEGEPPRKSTQEIQSPTTPSPSPPTTSHKPQTTPTPSEKPSKGKEGGPSKVRVTPQKSGAAAAPSQSSGKPVKTPPPLSKDKDGQSPPQPSSSLPNEKSSLAGRRNP